MTICCLYTSVALALPFIAYPPFIWAVYLSFYFVRYFSLLFFFFHRLLRILYESTQSYELSIVEAIFLHRSFIIEVSMLFELHHSFHSKKKRIFGKGRWRIRTQIGLFSDSLKKRIIRCRISRWIFFSRFGTVLTVIAWFYPRPIEPHF